MSDPLLMPRLSLKERDLRWKKIRDEMSKRSLDCLVISGDDSGRADSGIAHSHFMTCIGGNGEQAYTIFPVDGEPTCITMATGSWWWGRAQDWVSDIRPGFPKYSWANSIAKRVKELKLENRTIGVVGLRGLFWRDETKTHDIQTTQGTTEGRNIPRSNRHSRKSTIHEKSRSDRVSQRRQSSATLQ